MNLKISLINQTTIITQANAIITLKNDHVRDVKLFIILETSKSDTFIHVLVTVTWVNNVSNNAIIRFYLKCKIIFFFFFFLAIYHNNQNYYYKYDLMNHITLDYKYHQ